FDLSSVDGRMSFEATDGRFLKTSGATEGTLRVVGILNLTEVVRRLSLDLSNVYKSGVPFDTLEGELSFQQGHIEVPDIDVRSRSSRLQFAGMAETASRTVDGELVATLPIASNLPWLFALVSGLPAAAGVYVISKLFDDQMDRFSSAVYRVDGSWSDPEVSFERIFDNKPGQPAQPGAAQPGAAQPDAAESSKTPADAENAGSADAPPG
ncbi:MAG: AsmA-like C-terminal region-containing protein, partial [Halieaceae bacterium]|nr:AsmA-like C-terminal region-containing protein [Halieaceae bacterium]